MKDETFLKGMGRYWGVVAAASLGLGALTQWISGIGNFWLGFLAAAVLFFLSGSLMLLVWHKAGGGKVLAWMMILTFLLRLVLGMFLSWGLPRFGYDETTQQAGFVFEDAYRRDASAWSLAQSGEPLTRAFSDDYGTDQYGGMLALSALVYRTISPDAYRPGLILILTAAAMALSVPLLVATVRRRFDGRTAIWAGWILALYPEGVLLGASQMREPFYILFICALFWAVSHGLDRSKLKIAIPVFILNAVIFLLFSYRVAIPVLGVMVLWAWVDEMQRMENPRIKVIGWAVIGLVAGAILLYFRDWLDEVIHWDTLQTVRQSGVIQFYLENIPEAFHLPLVTIYGFFQPVLPAAIAAPAPWIWKVVAIFRAVGWYALLPLLIYSFFRVWKAVPPQKRHLIVFLLVVWAWILIASVRAGGDQWDNPRYRAIFLPWMAIVAGWGIKFAAENKDRWLKRWLIIEGVFLAFFTEWYLSRYTTDWPRLDFTVMIGLILLISLGVLVWGWLWDRKHPCDTMTER